MELLTPKYKLLLNLCGVSWSHFSLVVFVQFCMFFFPIFVQFSGAFLCLRQSCVYNIYSFAAFAPSAPVQLWCTSKTPKNDTIVTEERAVLILDSCAKVSENNDSSELQMNSNARCLPLTRFGPSPIACSLFCSSSSVWGRSRNTLWMKSHCLNPRIDSSHHPLRCSSARLQAALWQDKAAQS